MNFNRNLTDPKTMKSDACCFNITSDVDWHTDENSSISINQTRQMFVDHGWPVLADDENIFRCTTPEMLNRMPDSYKGPNGNVHFRPVDHLLYTAKCVSYASMLYSSVAMLAVSVWSASF